MLDFLFFDLGLAEKFADRARDLGAEAMVEVISAENSVQVRVPQAALSDQVLAALDEIYDQLFFIEQAELIEVGGSQADACGVQLQLASGEYTTVMMPPEEMNRLLSVFSPGEVQALFARIADAVENPQENTCTVCSVMGEKFEQLMRDGDLA